MIVNNKEKASAFSLFIIRKEPPDIGTVLLSGTPG